MARPAARSRGGVQGRRAGAAAGAPRDRKTAAADGCRSLRTFAAWLACAGLALGCAAGPRPCRSPGACPAGHECLAHRCAPLGAEPVRPGSERQVLEPVAVAVVHGGWQEGGGLPPSVTFGGPPGHGEQLLVRFERLAGERPIGTAFLLLEPVAEAEPTAEDVPVEVAIAAGAWSSGAVGHAPATIAPESDGLARTRPPSLLRIDVTAQVRAIAAQGGAGRGLVVRATAPTSRGAVYSTGAHGRPPRLDVYTSEAAEEP